MRLVTIGGIAALAGAAALAACSDQPSGSDLTGPLAKKALVEGARVRAQGTGTLSLMTARGMRSLPATAWSSEGSIRGGIARAEGSPSPLGVFAVTSAMRVRIAAAGGARRTDFTDAKGVRHTIVSLFGPDGGPPRAMQVYDDGQLTMTAAFEWTAASGGWLLRSATHRIFRGGAVIGEVNAAVSASAQIAARGFAPDALRRVASGAMRAFGPRELAAQGITTCLKENLEVIATAAVLAGLIASAELLPEITPVIWAAIITASAKAIEAEMAFYLCMENHQPPLRPGSGPPILPPIGCPDGGDAASCDLGMTQ